jgi:hypothetical protein
MLTLAPESLLTITGIRSDSQNIGLPADVTSYITLTGLLIWINVIFFSDIYKQIKTLRFESLDRLKDKVYQDDKLSFEILNTAMNEGLTGI